MKVSTTALKDSVLLISQSSNTGFLENTHMAVSRTTLAFHAITELTLILFYIIKKTPSKDPVDKLIQSCGKP